MSVDAARKDPERLAARLLEGDRRALSRGISWVEDEARGFERLLHAVHGRVGAARRIGITGPPGVGKSTLTAALARLYLTDGHRIGIVAVDPTSPFTGGALLGDRIRMPELTIEPNAFVRSMATRGAVGGLATATREVADLMDAAGYDRIVVETVGVGQSELEIAGSADSTVVVLVPESGDAIQAMKSGLMEVADLFAVNKADRPGADRLARELKVMFSIRRGRTLQGIPAHHHGRRMDVAEPGAADGAADGAAPEAPPWETPVVATTASTGEGVEALREELDRHAEHLERSGERERRRRAALVARSRAVLLRLAGSEADRVWRAADEEVRAALLEDGRSPYEVAEALFRRLLPEREP